MIGMFIGLFPMRNTESKLRFSRSRNGLEFQRFRARLKSKYEMKLNPGVAVLL
jgi:hypothetical protein